MKDKTIIIIGLILNIVFIVSFILYILLNTANDSSYLRFGPNDELIVIGIKIDSRLKYIVFNFFLFAAEILKSFIDNRISPMLYFYIYDTKRVDIEEFTYGELLSLSTFTYYFNSIRNIFIILIYISQFDIALLQVTYENLGNLFFISSLLNDKYKNIANNKSQKQTQETQQVVQRVLF